MGDGDIDDSDLGVVLAEIGCMSPVPGCCGRPGQSMSFAIPCQKIGHGRIRQLCPLSPHKMAECKISATLSPLAELILILSTVRPASGISTASRFAGLKPFEDIRFSVYFMMDYPVFYTHFIVDTSATCS